jgi:hypothetical protein
MAIFNLAPTPTQPSYTYSIAALIQPISLQWSLMLQILTIYLHLGLDLPGLQSKFHGQMLQFLEDHDQVEGLWTQQAH